MLIRFVLILIFGIILTEALTELTVKSKILSPFREFFFKKRKSSKLYNKIHELLDCGYCMSVWIGWFFGILLFNEYLLLNKYIDWFFIGLLLHRLSNFLHNIYDRIYREIELDL